MTFVYKIKDNKNFRISELKTTSKRSLKIINSNPHYYFYDCKIHSILDITDWRKDFKSNIISPIQYYGFINRQNFNKHGDVKYVSEISRLHFLPMLSINEESEIIVKIVKSWNNQNPYLMSINWTSGIDVAIRVTNLIYAMNILKNNKSLKKNDEKIIFNIIYNHYKYLKSHLSLFSSANNHLLAELMGLIVILCNYSFKKRDKMLQKYKEMLLTELNNQFYSDGGNIEQSLNYHFESLEYLVISLINMEKYGSKKFKDTWKNLEKIALFAREFKGKNGQWHIYGDSDNGKVLFPYNDDKFDYFSSILNTVGIKTKNQSLINESIKDDKRNHILLGENYRNMMIKNYYQKSECEYNSSLYKQSGYAIFNNKKSKLIFDVGSIGMKLLAAHGHSDLLHFVLEVDGIPFIIDPGTYQYHQKYKYWRNYFKGISSHNTISVNSLNQAKNVGRMIWDKHPSTKINYFKENNDSIVCEAEHNGFILQGTNVIHRRKIIYDKNINEYHILDVLLGNSSYKIDYYLHFHPKLKNVYIVDNELILESYSRTSIVLINDNFKNATIYHGNVNIPLGWYSATYGEKMPTWSLLFSKEICNNCNILTKIKMYIR